MGNPGGAEIDDSGMVEHNRSQDSQMRCYRHSHGAMAPTGRTRGLETGKHVTFQSTGSMSCREKRFLGADLCGHPPIAFRQ
jgi:hypothetical protein